MSNKSRDSLDTDLESINRRLDEIEGPIKETLDRVRQALVGTEDGTQQGLLARVLIAESSLEATQQAVNTAARVRRTLWVKAFTITNFSPRLWPSGHWEPISADYFPAPVGSGPGERCWVAVCSG